jgi:hypothetical protein
MRQAFVIGRSCAYCGEPADRLDHIIPLAHGRSDAQQPASPVRRVQRGEGRSLIGTGAAAFEVVLQNPESATKAGAAVIDAKQAAPDSSQVGPD